MAVNEPIRVAGPFVGDGVLVELDFDFETFSTSDISVVVTDADGVNDVLEIDTDYTVLLNSGSAGGTVTLLSPLATGTTANVYGDAMTYVRTGNIISNPGGFFPAIVNSALDRVHVGLIQLAALAERGFKSPRGEVGLTLPSALARAGKALGFNAGGDPIAVEINDTLDGSLRADLADDDPAKGAALSRLSQGGTVADAILYVTPQMFGAAGSALVNSTVAIQAAIDSGVAEVRYPPGTYIHGNLTFDNIYQRHVGHGAHFIRNANGTTITVSARGNQFYGFRFSGGGFTGNNITVAAPEAVFDKCDSVETPGRALLADSDGGNLLIDGGIWNTTDASGAGYDIELKHTGGSSSLYSKLIGVSTNQATGGVLIDGQGTVRLTGCQIGKFTVTSGGGFYVANRFNGAVSVQSAGNYFSANAFAGNVTFGDGAGGNIGNIVFDASNGMQSGTTFTISSDVVESAFFLNQLIGVTLTLNGPNNDIWHGAIAYTPTMVGSGTSLGNGTLTGQYSRNGRAFNAYIQFAKGSTTNLGTTFGFTAPFKSSTRSQGNGICVVAGGIYNACADLAANTANITVFAGAVPIGGGLTATSPATWADGDQALLSVGGEYVA